MAALSVSLAALLVAVCFASTIKAGWAFHFPGEIPSDQSLKLTSKQRTILQKTNEGLEKFSLELFMKLSEQYSSTEVNFVASPFSIWSLLLLITEGATGSSRKQLQTALGAPNGEQALRQAYQIIHNNLNISTSSVEIKTLQALFPNIHLPINRHFEDIMEQSYRANIIPVDYMKPEEAAATINDEVRRATNNFITDVLDPVALYRIRLLMLTTLYFKGQWKFQFKKTDSQEEPFYDKERKNKITTVTMMKQSSPFAYLASPYLKSQVVELPYGSDTRFSMVLFLPLTGVSVVDVVKKLKTIGIANVLSELDQSLRDFEDEDVELQLPKFTASFGFTANEILESMGVKDVFIPGNLKNIHPLMSISNLQQNAKIIVNEEGTTAAAVSFFVNKISPPKAVFNRPFAYMIVDRETKSLLFCGQVMKPTYSP